MSVTDRVGAALTATPLMSEPPTRPPMPRINEPAPDFEANTTHGPRRLSDYRGKWLVFFAHPGDFTPVCTSEFVALSKAYPEFQRRNTELLGTSVDGLAAHLAWTKEIKEKFGVEVPFPIIEDLSMHVASLYGMVHPAESSTKPVRALFVIDDKGLMRAIIYYPSSTGRNIAEVLRLVDALQTSDAYDVITPEGWKPGNEVLVPPPKTEADRKERLQATDLECVDWFYCKKHLTPPPSK
jgi:peroxiredoxin (alkyl hydroperoxide reductase subunit C)